LVHSLFLPVFGLVTMSVSSDPFTDSTVACFAVRAAADPGVLSRVIELFAKRGLVPSSVHARRIGSGDDASLLIDVQIDGVDADLAERIADALRQNVLVDRVLTARKRLARAA
jgi:acetolactate synthase small subunit